MNPREVISFHKSIILSQYDGIQTSDGLEPGQIRYNRSKHQFEGYHDVDSKDINGNQWRAFQLDIATEKRLGGIKIGSNLIMNPDTGVLSAIANGISRIRTRIITIANKPHIADFCSVSDAIAAISNKEPTDTNPIASPSISNPIILEFTPGIHNLNQQNITIPDSIIISGFGNSTILQGGHLTLQGNNTIQNILIQNTTITINNTNNIHFYRIFATNEPRIYIESSNNIQITHCNFTTNTGVIISRNSNFNIDRCNLEARYGPAIHTSFDNQTLALDSCIVKYTTIQTIYSNSIYVSNQNLEISHCQIECKNGPAIKIEPTKSAAGIWVQNATPESNPPISQSELFASNIISSPNIIYHISVANTSKTFTNGINRIKSISSGEHNTQNIEISNYWNTFATIVNTSLPGLQIRELFQIHITNCTIDGDISSDNYDDETFLCIMTGGVFNGRWELKSGMYVEDNTLATNIIKDGLQLDACLLNATKIGVAKIEIKFIGNIIHLADLQFDNWDWFDMITLDGCNRGELDFASATSWNLAEKNLNLRRMRIIFGGGEFEFKNLENVKFIDCNFQMPKGGISLADCVGIGFQGCTWVMECIANNGIQISNAKITFQNCAMKFQSCAYGTIRGIHINTASLVRISSLDLQIASAQLESNIVGIEISDDGYPSKVWMWSVDYNLDAPEITNYINQLE